MGDGEPADQDEEPGRDEWDEATRKIEFIETDDDALVLWNGRNPLAWIKSSYFGVPIDILEPVSRGEEADGSDSDPGTDEGCSEGS